MLHRRGLLFFAAPGLQGIACRNTHSLLFILCRLNSKRQGRIPLQALKVALSLICISWVEEKHRCTLQGRSSRVSMTKRGERDLYFSQLLNPIIPQTPDVFATFDTNEDGFLTREQLRTYFNYVMQLLMSIREAVSFGPNAEAIEQYIDQCMEVGCKVAAMVSALVSALYLEKNAHSVLTPASPPI